MVAFVVSVAASSQGGLYGFCIIHQKKKEKEKKGYQSLFNNPLLTIEPGRSGIKPGFANEMLTDEQLCMRE
jgi:hypothetical protein